MLEGHPKDDAPSEWYMAARVVALTCVANEAFQALRTTATMAPSNFAGVHRPSEPLNRFAPSPPVWLELAPTAPAPGPSSGPAPMDVDAVKK